jgi:FkbM family methyltransferase
MGFLSASLMGVSNMFTQRWRHLLLQKMFWNPIGAWLVHALIRYERKFDVVVRNYSLIGFSNGERWLLTLMSDEPIVFDVGFHDGASTREILRIRPKARVTGFDPSHFALRCYQRSFGNDATVAFENIGLSSEPGELELYDYGNMCNSLAPRKEMPGETPTIYKISVTTLDKFVAKRGIDRIDMLKVDAEGYDLNVLEGARDLLANQGVDLLMFEFASGWSASKRYLWEAAEYFKPLPYRLYHLFNGFLCPLTYDVRIDSCCTLPAMYVGVSHQRMTRGDIPVREYRF